MVSAVPFVLYESLGRDAVCIPSKVTPRPPPLGSSVSTPSQPLPPSRERQGEHKNTKQEKVLSAELPGTKIIPIGEGKCRAGFGVIPASLQEGGHDPALQQEVLGLDLAELP